MSSPKPSSPVGTILSVGVDLNLLRTRELILQLTGAVVISLPPQEALILLNKQHFNLVVLCHGLSEQDVSALCRVAADVGSPTSVVLFGSRVGPVALPAERTLVLSPWAHPAQLLVAARGLLSAA